MKNTAAAIALALLTCACSGTRVARPAGFEVPLGAQLVALEATDSGLVGTVVVPYGTVPSRLAVVVDGQRIALEPVLASRVLRRPIRATFHVPAH